MYRPVEANQMTTPMRLRLASSSYVGGVNKKVYADVEGNEGIVWCNFKTYGGTEHEVNGLYVVEDTADIVTWFRPDITSDCQLKRLSDGAVFEVIGEPENLEMRSMFLKFKIRRVKGGA